MSLLFLLQTPTPAPVVISVPERMPALLTLIYLGGFSLLILLLLVSLLRNRRRSSAPYRNFTRRPASSCAASSWFHFYKSRVAGLALDLCAASSRHVWLSYLLVALR